MGLDQYLSAELRVSPDHPRNAEIVAMFDREAARKYGDEPAHNFISGWDYSETSKDARYDRLTDLIGIKADPGSPSLYLSVEDDGTAVIAINIAYWRKANQLHRWFVENVQDGADDCDRYPVHNEQLAGLVALCEEVLNNPDSAETNLPTQAGFFFGSTKYDEYYAEDLKYTITRLKEVLLHPALRGASIYYDSSW